MSEIESTALETITSGIGNLPAGVKTSFLRATLQLLGGLSAIPAAKLKQWAQATEDDTLARSATAAILAKATAEAAIKDPLVMQAAAEVFLPTNVRKAKNRLSVAQSAAEHLVNDTADSTSSDQAAPPEDDWINSFMRFAEDASSERMQNLFGRILAGQVLKPGAFGLATLRALSELDQTTANDFTLAWEKSVGGAVDYGPEWTRGEGFSRWKRLSEAGLMATNDVAQFPPTFQPIYNDIAMWGAIQTGPLFLNVHFKQGSTSKWVHIDFTRIGREIGKLLATPNYKANILEAANRLPRHGLARIELHEAGIGIQVVWQDQS